MGAFFIRSFQGIQGDGAFYYCTTVSLVWDGDLDLRNQFDHPDPTAPGLTMTRGLYAIDETTGKAFSPFNPGTGFLMAPGAAVGRVVNRLTGRRHADPFDPFYARFAASTAVLLSALTLVILFSLLRRFVSFGVAAAVPFLSLFATNWLFYAGAFASWSHVYALFLCAGLAWSFVRFTERPSAGAAALFGLAGGLFFSTRSFSILLFLPLCAAWALFPPAAATDAPPPARGRIFARLLLLAAGALGFLAGAAPQLALNAATHGSLFRTTPNIFGSGAKVFGFPESTAVRIFDPANLEFLATNLWNANNGLFRTHLFFLAGLIGVLLWTHRAAGPRRLLNALLPGVFALWFADAGYWDSWFNRAAGAGFGHRRFLDILPFFILGAAALLEWARGAKVRRVLAAAGFSLLAGAGFALFLVFLRNYPAYVAVRDSFPALYRTLLLNGPGLFVAAVFLLLLLLLVKPAGTADPLRQRFRTPLVLAVLTAFAVLPVLAFRPDPAAQRARFLERRGFFLLYDPNPFVNLPARAWGVPGFMSRPMLSSSAEIRLPAPLESGDILLFSLSAAPRAGDSAEALEAFLNGAKIGRAALRAGKQVVQFLVPPGVRPGRSLSLKVSGRADPAGPLLFHEGRIVQKEARGRPFGKVEFPPGGAMVASGSALVKGWVLADKGVARVYAVPDRPEERGGLEERSGARVFAEAELGAEERPEIERTYVLYPDILKAGWKMTVDRKSLPPGAGESARFKIVAVGNDGAEAALGRVWIVWRD